MGSLFVNIFGDKSALQSLTAWGLVIFLCGETFVVQVCGGPEGLLPAGVCGALESVITNVGVVMTALGLRRAAN
jgi:hypothetical protein